MTDMRRLFRPLFDGRGGQTWAMSSLWRRWRRHVRRDWVLAEAQRVQEEEQAAARLRVLDAIRAQGPNLGAPQGRPANRGRW